MHVIIASTVFQNRTFRFRFGSVGPDWIKRSPIHRKEETFEQVMEWYHNLPQMDDKQRNLYQGYICHFICDYCTFAHGERYYDLLGHRIYEVQMQKYFLSHREQISRKYMKYRDSRENLYNSLSEQEKNNLSDYIFQYLEKLEKKNMSYGNPKWFQDQRIMKNDIWAAYVVLDLLDKVLRE